MALVGTPYAPEVIPLDPFAGSPLGRYPHPGTSAPQAPYVDVSLLSPDQQFAALTAYLESADAMNPAPFTGTPPWTEGIHPDELINPSIIQEEYVIPPDVESMAAQDLQQRIRDAYEPETYVPYMEPDDQYGGLGVPPGPPNLDQPIEYGDTQIIRNNPAACHGDKAWSGAPALARVARMFNGFPSYNAGQSRGHGVVPVKMEVPYVWLTQQYRDLLLAELKQRGVHNVVVSDIPSVPYTQQVLQVDPSVMTAEAPIGPEGVVAW